MINPMNLDNFWLLIDNAFRPTVDSRISCNLETKASTQLSHMKFDYEECDNVVTLALSSKCCVHFAFQSLSLVHCSFDEEILVY